jgi:DNA-binding MarR family transcriptional regulator
MRLIHGVTVLHSERATMGLNVRQRLILQRLGVDGALPIAVLGERLGLPASTMTGLADRLEEEGYVQRKAHPTDRRAKQVALTRKGVAAFRNEADFYLSLLSETISALGGDARAHILGALETIARRQGATA